jgi:hypothetical protein
MRWLKILWGYWYRRLVPKIEGYRRFENCLRLQLGWIWDAGIDFFGVEDFFSFGEG